MNDTLNYYNQNTEHFIKGTLHVDFRAVQDELDAYPSLRKMYDENDGNTVVYYLKDATAVIAAFTHEPETIQF